MTETVETTVKKAINVRSAALKDSMFCNYSYNHTVAANTTNGISVKSAIPVHNDMLQAFADLKPHLGVICEEIDHNELPGNLMPEDEESPIYEKVHAFKVTAFKLEGAESGEGVVLVGQKKLSTGESIKLETPKIQWGDRDYPLVYELQAAINNCIFEVEEYMQGKQAPVQQLEMFENEENENVSEELGV